MEIPIFRGVNGSHMTPYSKPQAPYAKEEHKIFLHSFHTLKTDIIKDIV